MNCTRGGVNRDRHLIAFQPIEDTEQTNGISRPVEGRAGVTVASS